ncbi:MAG: threonine synthase [Patescibacteria group bacterium]|nr:threonine synthase [Patescibacteria group bacterium]
MIYRSTNKGSSGKKFKDVLFEGLAPDGGLYMPEKSPSLNDGFLAEFERKSFGEIALEVGRLFIDDIPEKDLKEIIDDAFSGDAFIDCGSECPAPLVKISNNIYVEELWHGPTMAFKDFGARFMSRVMGYFLRQTKKELKIIVATSGDTGSAVAAGFYNVPNIKVYILYPSGKVSDLQEKQLTTFGGNITAIEVNGAFDDCQKLAKQILGDKELNGKGEFSSANSINFGRLLPQMFYYFFGYGQLAKKLNVNSQKLNVSFSVPSGNFGDLTAGLMCKKIGLPIIKFIAATNINDVVPEYLHTGVYRPRVSQKTMSNSMDVGNPSNFARMLDLYQNDAKLMAKDIVGISVNEEETAETIKLVYKENGYLLDTHSSVAVKAAQESGIKDAIISLSTAHPVKFKDAIEPMIGKKIGIPEKLKETMSKEKKAILIENDIEELKDVLRKN